MTATNRGSGGDLATDISRQTSSRSPDPGETDVQDLEGHRMLESTMPGLVDRAGIVAGDQIVEHVVAYRVPWSKHRRW
jgi:hypothetical protein